MREKNSPQRPIRETKCPLCPSTFRTMSFLKQHLSASHFYVQIKEVLRKESCGSMLRCPDCGREEEAVKGNLVIHYGSRHNRVLDFADEKLRRWLKGLGVQRHQ